MTAALASDTAMILAAGLGKRMRPLTATQPKPLVRVAGKPLIDHVLDQLDSAGVAKAVVNVHYLADSLEGHLDVRKRGPAVAISDERELLLETGGGMVKALSQLPDPFFATNSDNVWLDGPRNAFAELSAGWDPARMDALLLLVPLARANCHSGIGDFHMDPGGRIVRRRASKVAPFVYTGLQIVSKRLFTDLPEGPFSFNLLWNRAITADRAFGLVHQGLWFDVGTPPAIAKTEAILGRN